VVDAGALLDEMLFVTGTRLALGGEA
jgi:hypothetical protein